LKQRTVRSLGDIRSEDAGSIRSEENLRVSGQVDVQRGVVGGVEDGVKVSSLEEGGACENEVRNAN
jgi:hypothetical protein